MSRSAFFITALLFAHSQFSYAQQPGSDGIDDVVVVYGARMEQVITEVGSSVSVITADELDALGVDYVLDAIATVPGISVNQNGTFGGVATVRIRGASGEQTLIIIDGVVVNDPTSPGGGYDFARLDPSNIERIEVLKGPQSTLWGTDAMGGVVNIITKSPQQGFDGKLFAQGGSYNAFRGGAAISNANERYDFRLAATQHTTDGISKADKRNGNTEKDGFDSTSISLRGGVNLPADARLQATVLWTDADADFDSFVFGEQGNVGDGDELSVVEELTSNLTLTLPLLDGRLDNSFLIGFADIDRESFTDGIAGFGSKGERLSYRYQGTLRINDSNRLAFGAEREEMESSGDDTSIDGLFALYEMQLGDTLTLTGGLRRDDHERFGGETTGRFAVAYNPLERVTLQASWGEGFKAPTLFQTTFFCCGALAPNPDVRPESSEAWDVGVTVRSEDARGEFGITYFDQDTTDLINFSFALGGYENIARARSKGFEVQADYQLLEWLELSANYANIRAKDGSGAALIRVPEHSGDLSLRFDPEGQLSGMMLLRYNGKEQDPNGAIDSWTRVDVSAMYALSDTVELYARVENLFDEQYQQVIGYGTPGLSGHIGARFAF